MWGKKLLIPEVAILLVLTFAASVSIAAEKQTPLQTKSPARNIDQANDITQYAIKAGMTSCAGRINQVTNFLLAGSQGSGAMVFLPNANPDTHLFSASIEIPLGNQSAYASVSFAPIQAGGCDGMYETVVYWPQNCAQVAERQFGAFQKANALAKTIAVRESGATVKVFLMPAGAGCVSIKKEVVR